MAIPTPVSFWNFDESSGNAIDALGLNNLTNNNTVTYVAGLIGNAANFVRSSSQYFQISDAAQTGLDITGNLSMSMWINLANALSTYANETFMAKYDYTIPQQSYSLDAFQDSGVDKFRFITSSNGSNNDQMTISTGITLSTSTWYHIAVVFTAASATTELYLNGVSKGTATGSFTSIFNSTAPFQISAFSNQTEYINGKMDMAGIWNTTLTSADITELYNGGAGLQYPFYSAQNSNFLMYMA